MQVKAQSTLQGRVSDGNTPIDFAQVYVQDLEGKILAYTFTDSLGGFKLTFETEEASVLIRVARLGYEPFQKVVSATQTVIDVSLSLANESTLKEVVVTEGQPVEVEGDTISYFVESFRDGSEDNVEDLLAKLPGVSVDEESGTIKYQGKEIKKILLDGDDLTGENYKVLSKNLSAEWLEEVEVLKRFTDSRLLQGIQQSNEVAINLKLKEEAKAPLFGTIEAGGGNTSKYFARPELLSYLKKLKLYATGEANNTGTDLQTYDLETYINSQLEYKGFILPEPTVNNQLDAPNFLKQERFTFHEGQFFSNSMLANLSPKTSLRAITTIYNNRLNFNFSDSLLYFLPSGDGFSFIQRQQQVQRPFEFFQDLKTESQLSANQDLVVRFQGKYITDKPMTTNLIGFSTYNDRADLQMNEWYGGLSYLNNLNQRWVNTLDVEVGNNKGNELFVLSGENSESDSIKQSTTQDFFNAGIFNRLDGIIKKSWFVNILAGWSINDADFKIVENELLNEFQVTNTYHFNHLFSELKVEKKIKKTALSLGGRLRNATVKFNEDASGDVYFEPIVGFSTGRDLGKTSLKLGGLYNIEYVFPKPNQLITPSLLTDYRTAISFNADPNTPVKNEIGIASIDLTERNVSFLSANAEWVYLKSNAILAPQLMFEGEAIINNQLQGGSSNNFFSAYSVDKYFAIINSTFKVAYDYDRRITPLTIEDQQDRSKLSQKTLSVTSGISITDQINLSLAFKSYESHNRWAQEENKFNFNKYFAKIVFKPIKSLRLTIDYQAIDFRQSNDFSSILNASAFYSVLDDKFSIKLTGNNLMNRDAVILFAIEPSVFSNSSYPLQPMFILVSGEYRF
ncbi:MAG: carboxypeptidase-like regulatory domain-containing protein [Ekhidna sp.]|nr:carboxypeptidase-like regulatory domain-containing protein [Ekhidna sp.]